MDKEELNEKIEEALFWLEKSLDPYKAPEEKKRFIETAIRGLKGEG